MRDIVEQLFFDLVWSHEKRHIMNHIRLQQFMCVMRRLIQLLKTARDPMIVTQVRRVRRVIRASLKQLRLIILATYPNITAIQYDQYWKDCESVRLDQIYKFRMLEGEELLMVFKVISPLPSVQ